MLNFLEGVRVLDFTQFLAGPYCTMVLGDLGAEVIKVERPRVGEVYRTYGPKFIKGESSSFLSVNRNKKSIVIDLKDARGIEIVKRLVAETDVLVENFKSGTMDRLGLGYEELKQINPALIYCSISGFGSTGPYRDRGGFDLIVQGMSGLMSMTGEADGPPVKVGTPISDMGGAAFGTIGILAALIERAKSGKGQYIDASLLDASLAWTTLPIGNYLADGEIPGRLGSASPQNAPYQAFATSNGHLTIGTGNQRLWETLCKIMGLEELIHDERFPDNAARVRNQKELAALLEEKFKERTTEYWIEVLNDAGIPTGPIYNMEEALNDPHVRARGVLWEVDHPRAGKVTVMGLPIKFSAASGDAPQAPPLLGEHTKAVLHRAGYTKEEIEQFYSDEIVG